MFINTSNLASMQKILDTKFQHLQLNFHSHVKQL